MPTWRTPRVQLLQRLYGCGKRTKLALAVHSIHAISSDTASSYQLCCLQRHQIGTPPDPNASKPLSDSQTPHFPLCKLSSYFVFRRMSESCFLVILWQSGAHGLAKTTTALRMPILLSKYPLYNGDSTTAFPLLGRLPEWGITITAFAQSDDSYGIRI